jgi:hypothetical protein
MAEDRTADTGSAGILFCCGVSVAGATDVADDGDEPIAGGAGGVAAGLCVGLCAEEC